ncbi:PQQ-dependent sugar dehydrogenase [Leifsonia shinshuensis]|uniref:PQQ-dependent sugar dehydrogenase n=2 Tax=Leifsonia shinshuensis TaxID=150026 RepID=A0A7G6YH63_9MICO|nr:PQQ-dependent sugar dehydrogenase [Leifsonia shinshuensis]QNE37828.1 PQQ-dependent sugar dehydrogenase [Leifsonia shinshuensis]
MRRSRSVLAATALAAAMALAACAGPQPAPTATRTASSAPRPTYSGAPPFAAIPWQPGTTTTVLEKGLDAPWSVVPLPSGSALISERDSGKVVERLPSGGLRDVGAVPGSVHLGEGGLLGLAVPPGSTPPYLYAYETTRSDNRVVRLPLSGVPGSYALGAPEPVLTGIPRAANHDGGRLAFGPDGMLYVTTGDAANPANAQDLSSLGGKILRITPEGQVPHDNPFPGSPVWSYGHRNVQGIGWDAHGTMWASELGLNTWDELNIIVAGGNYGWPVHEGVAHDPKYVDPVAEWPPGQASPSGLAVVGDTVFVAALRGERLWTAWSTAGHAPVTVRAFLDGDLGRLRDVVGRGDSLWLLTNNTDGRGSPRAGDDELVQVPLIPAQNTRQPGQRRFADYA